jgi:ABC-type phosphate/phosphonate transport system substrate-binding protein
MRLTAVLILIGIGVPSPSVGQEASDVSILISSMLFYNVSTDDGLKTVDSIIGSLFRTIAPGTGVFRSTEELRTLSDEGMADVAVMHPLEFLQIEGRTSLVPAFTASNNGQLEYGLVLLVAADSEFETVGSLKNRKVVIEALKRGSVPDLWMLSLCEEAAVNGVPVTVDRRIVSRGIQAVLAVYFGQAEACVVDKEGYRQLIEENPQVGYDLRAISEVGGMCRAVICVQPEHPAIDQINEVILTLHDTPQGSILLNMFSVDQLLPLEQEQLTAVRRLSVFSDRARKSSKPGRSVANE